VPLIQVWKCPRTGELFEEKYKYLDHLEELAKENRHKLRPGAARAADARFNEATRELHRSSTFDDISDWINVHSTRLFDAKEIYDDWGHYAREPYVSKFSIRFPGDYVWQHPAHMIQTTMILNFSVGRRQSLNSQRELYNNALKAVGINNTSRFGKSLSDLSDNVLIEYDKVFLTDKHWTSLLMRLRLNEIEAASMQTSA
jgi:hypothetical protein